MLPDQVDEMIANYGTHDARCAHLVNSIRQTEVLLAALQEASYDIKRELTDMPHGTSISDTTGRKAANILDGEKSEEVMGVERDLAEMRRELAQKSLTVGFVDAWLLALPDKERFVMRRKVLGGLSWRQTIFAFEKEFGDRYSVEGLKRIGRVAMKNIYRIACEPSAGGVA